MPNTHKYTMTLVEELPPGRFLNEGELVKLGDLYCNAFAMSVPVFFDQVGIIVNKFETKSFYRPEKNNA